MTISEKIEMFYRLAQEIQQDALELAKKAPDRPTARFFEDEFRLGTTIGNIVSPASGFYSVTVQRTKFYEAKVLGHPMPDKESNSKTAKPEWNPESKSYSHSVT